MKVNLSSFELSYLRSADTFKKKKVGMPGGQWWIVMMKRASNVTFQDQKNSKSVL